MKVINIGIDLGTTNSAIAKYEDGKVIVYKNPVGFSETLPSVISFKENKILVGNKARERMLIDHVNTFSSFKRKMGTNEAYYVDILRKEITPEELSSYILSELTNFVIDKKENIQSAIITIPASFDTVQSNSTKKAGYMVGIEEVILLQEPIAACIAYSNSQNLKIEQEENWLVYDFGGGTFDVSLAKISDRSLKIIDHRGNNFLGGVDIDILVVQKIICPAIEKKYTNKKDIWGKIIANDDAHYKKFFHEILFKAEEAKKELSIRNNTIIEIENSDLNIYTDIEISIDLFNSILKPKFNISYDLLENLVKDNNLTFNNISRIILIGGTTYIPYIREELHQRTKVLIDPSIDPTTSVVMGAAYYASTKESKITNLISKSYHGVIQETIIDTDWSYEAHSNDSEELIVCNFKKEIKGFYRITRLDGGFDSGLINFENSISVFVPLLEKTNNEFKISILDKNKKNIFEKDDIIILHGKYNIMGQPLPNDIAIEIDGQDGSLLETIFKKNDILPLSKTIYKVASKSISVVSNEKLIINIREGDSRNSAESNLLIGCIEITSKDLSFDIIKGVDVELIFHMSESRDLRIEVFIDSINLKLSQVFSPTERKIDIERIINTLNKSIEKISSEISLLDNSQKELIDKLSIIQNDLVTLYGISVENKNNKLTEIKYQIDEQLRKLIHEYDKTIRHIHILEEIENYHSLKTSLQGKLELLNKDQKKTYNKIIEGEKGFLESGNVSLIKINIEKLEELYNQIQKGSNEYFLDFFYYFKHSIDVKLALKSKSKYYSLITDGETAIGNHNFIELKHIITELYYNMQESYINENFKKNKSQDQTNKFDLLGLK